MRKLLKVFLQPRVRLAFGHDLREFALLWIVFANLDVFVQNRLTLRWGVGNILFTSALWVAGIYIETRDKESD